MNAEEFNLDMLISSMKELRQMQLDDQVRQALENAKLKLDPGTLEDFIHELETDIEEHIERLERISNVLHEQERNHPELMEDDRRREVAFQSGCDLEEVDSLCEAFSRAREILAGLKKGGGGVIDVKLLFSNLPGLTGLPGTEDEPGKASSLLRGLLDGTIHTRKTPDPDLNELTARNDEFEALFDLEATSAPRNRLPKDWKP
ncbi:MAG: hypothetical protein H6839_06760 [Planctomycetes bacterium]|nr:hypothetical protein [Planctomycetota bacterium]